MNAKGVRLMMNTDGQSWRWRPPSPHVGAGLVQRVLLRQLEQRTPEARLAVALIVQAMLDCLDGNDLVRRDAQAFFAGARLETWAYRLGMAPEFVRALARQAGYWVEERRLWQAVDLLPQRGGRNGKAMEVPHAGLQ